MEKVIETIVDFLSRFAAIAVGLLTALVVVSAVLRYVVGTPLRFSDELVSLLYLASAFLTLPKGSLRRNAVQVAVVSGRLSGRAAHVFELLAALVLLTFAVWLGLITYEFTALNHEIGARTEQADMPLWIWTALMPASLCVVGFVAAANILQAFLKILRSDEASFS